MAFSYPDKNYVTLNINVQNVNLDYKNIQIPLLAHLPNFMTNLLVYNFYSLCTQLFAKCCSQASEAF